MGQALGRSKGGQPGVYDDEGSARQGRDGPASRGEVGLADEVARHRHRIGCCACACEGHSPHEPGSSLTLVFCGYVRTRRETKNYCREHPVDLSENMDECTNR